MREEKAVPLVNNFSDLYNINSQDEYIRVRIIGAYQSIVRNNTAVFTYSTINATLQFARILFVHL